MRRTLIVARMEPADADSVADIFADSDATELPGLVGVTRRTLFHFHDLYFHLAEAETDVPSRVDEVRQHRLFRDVSDRLAPYVLPYDPSWRGPRDAMATPFYEWEKGQGGRRV
ncbi:TcmI family type II polyketide cyclase [Nonomuraea sp. KC401]|uniref:TcmI family type II polyketide cyclase n=1 Tax=Nonomuraea longispora TaxID=1848320 RepID=A0A4V2XKZ0_9ACTN|nr:MULTISPECIES: TcmI family type II polyketide cyclase [Nonomuraea]NBE93744.1 TcmI family type II polyketide cyclase [Nonomuraea sp. K271]TDC08176.1 TcmI family type II polyketide cyclase [Nonomuraea longispora]TLF77004.1 TcmI family type II polyketide cyclase [Nonomuraea sp. KC401]